MPTTNLDQRVKRIANLSDADCQALDNDGITTEEDLRFLEFVDLPATIAVVKRRKLNVITKYLARDKSLTGTITIQEVQLDNASGQAGNAGTGGPPGANIVDPNRGAPKVYTNPLPDFSGDAVDYEEWERKTGAIIKQSVYKVFVTRAATPLDMIEEARSMELFNMILSCVGSGHALNMVEKIRDDNNGKECGYSAWKALKDWYLDGTQTDTMISHWEK